jgi:aminopeptidase N
VAAVVLVPALALAASDVGDPGALTAGSPGIGDPYYPLDGNGGYDVERYDLDVRYDPGTDELVGEATVRAVADQELSRFNLDLSGLTVQEVTVDGRPASARRTADELVVTPAQRLRAGQTFTTVVRYSGEPRPVQDELGDSGFIHTPDGAVVAGQPDSAATWFPSNDHPRDAAALSVTATVPAGLVAVSNGVLADRHTDGDWTTWRWEADEPMATYLVTLAIGEFDLQERVVDGVRYWDAIDPAIDRRDDDGRSRVAVAEAALARQPEVIDLIAEWFGPYPFTVGGGIVDDGYTDALETQTRPVYDSGYFTDRRDAEDVVAHELAHQWAGDLVRLERWQDIWLNEGFATYAEWLWAEHDGRRTVQERVDDLLDEGSGDDLWDVAPGDPGPASEDLFSDAVYERGALTLHALREQVGDGAFRRILRSWTATYAGQAVTTADFIALAEQVSGQRLDELFEVWLYTPGRPAVLG